LPSSEECRRHVEAEFAWPTITRQIRALYWQVATGDELAAIRAPGGPES
jgi:hypothetical protein